MSQKKDRVILLGGLHVLLFVVATRAFAFGNCSLSPEVLDANLKLDLKQFDQTEGKGQRALAAQSCYFESAMLIDIYNLDHPALVTASERRILYFHAGQMYAFSMQYPVAVRRFENSLDPDEPANSDKTWNIYVKATIAFLKGDTKTLKNSRAAISAKTPNDSNKLYLNILDHMLRCPSAPYIRTYNTLPLEAKETPC